MQATVDAGSLYNLFWEWRLYNAPQFATFIGDHRYDNAWNDLSNAARLAQIEFCERFLQHIASLQGEAAVNDVGIYSI